MAASSAFLFLSVLIFSSNGFLSSCFLFCGMKQKKHAVIIIVALCPVITGVSLQCLHEES